jgi:Plavaka transposase
LPPPPTPAPDHAPSVSSQPHRSHILAILRTPRNVFGLSRQYTSTECLRHDPEELVTLQDLSDSHTEDIPPLLSGNNTFYPYPNETSFRLGDWYWNHGVQKSQEGFRDLVKIIGDPNFTPDDIRHTNWSEINSKLAANDFDANPNPEEWLDEDAGWKCTPISITVPFHRRAKNPGPRNHTVVELYHRSLVSVIREKLADKSDDQKFHYEPYELFWQRTEQSVEVRVYGELYTSLAFCKAHSDVQESPRMPGCNLPRVVVGLMFWSDATHLTSFGNAKLWPCYVFFGNESKYRRCKPTDNLCNHIAYFQAVRLILLVADGNSLFFLFIPAT